VSNNPLFYDATIVAGVNAACTLPNSGFLNIYTGSQPSLDGALTGTLLASLPLNADAFANATASGGVVTAAANSITSASAVATGTAGYHAVLEDDGLTVVWTGSAGLSGADLNLSSTAIVLGALVTCSSYTYSQAQT
jgi:hypothetical protein